MNNRNKKKQKAALCAKPREFDRNQRINRFEQDIFSAIEQDLDLKSMKHIQDLATKNSIDITNKSRNKLINDIYKKTKNMDGCRE